LDISRTVTRADDDELSCSRQQPSPWRRENASKLLSPGDIMRILLIVVLILLFGSGGYYYGRGAGCRGPPYGGGLLGLVLIHSVGPLADRDHGPGDVALSARSWVTRRPTPAILHIFAGALKAWWDDDALRRIARRDDGAVRAAVRRLAWRASRLA
jgi:hypothetical protein